MRFFFHLHFQLLCLFCQSKGTLPAQCWAPEPTGEGGSQLLSAIVPRRGPHPEGATQHSALPADSSELPTKLLETQHPPGYHRGWRGGRWLRPEFFFFNSWKDSYDCMTSYALPWVRLSGTRAQEWGPNTSDQHLQLLETLMYCVPCYAQLFLLL